MEIWFLDDVERLHKERTAIQHLCDTAEWLQFAEWELQEAQLVVHAVINSQNYSYEVVMTYPKLFPAVPPVVRPKSLHAIWSRHQYTDGTLCLEWGPDTWHSSVSGAQILESTYNLLNQENPLGTGEHIEVLSRHNLTLGQELRVHKARLFLSNELKDYIEQLTATNLIYGTCSFHVQQDAFLFLVSNISSLTGEMWFDTSIPSTMHKENSYPTIFLLTEVANQKLELIQEANELTEVVDNEEFRAAITTCSRITLVVLIATNFKLYSFVLFPSENELSLIPLTVIQDTDRDCWQRIPQEYKPLFDRKVGIIGVGSMGSKVAFSLARNGIKRFLLIDDDIFLPGNISRHVLDWRNVGEHKVDGVARSLSYIAPNIDVDVAKLRLAGQESSSSLSQLLSNLGQCDLLLDATANPEVFNLVTAVVKYYSRPLIWAEVFGGGIGGFMGRSRLNTDLDPHSMRYAYYSYLQENQIANPAPYLANYAGTTDTGEILQATDADVSVIADHVSRFALDTLLPSERSIYPHSMYLIGLRQAWVFKAPFDTIPIDVQNLSIPLVSKQINAEVTSEALRFVKSLIEKRANADPSSDES